MNHDRYQLITAALSDPGRVRPLNEDAAAANPEFGFALVADGMGGHNAGNLASQIAMTRLCERLPYKIGHYRAGARQPRPHQFAEQLINETNRAIHDWAQTHSGCQGMGTTIALVLIYADRAAILHVGDSRIYRLRNGQLQQLTRDDSLLSDQIEAGVISAEEAADSHNRHFVTRALGVSTQLAVHILEEEISVGDVFLLCTDGLTDMVDDDDIERVIDQLKTNLPLTAQQLVQLANDNGGKDNVSVALIRVTEATHASGNGLLGRLRAWINR